MSKTWFPVINYDKCDECGACVTKCSHDVYDKDKGPLPIVIFPEGCIEGCHGCGNLCPNNAIDYYGENLREDKIGSCCKD
jgi:NAD-dependent dihydropyrimidine dehydrogenase PreA subunit